MQPRTLQQIISELNPTFQAQTQSLQQRQQLIPEQIKSEEAALGAKQTEAFDNILGGARRRGLGFAGIPLGEQARYSATEYLPALARLRQQGQQQAMSLQDAILGINERRDTLAQQIFQTEQDRAFQREQAEANRRAQAAANAALMPTLGGFGGSTSQTPQPQAGPRAILKSAGNAQFVDANNKPITAGQFARAKGMDIRDVLYDIGQNGDARAAQLYNQLRILSGNALTNAIRSYERTFPYIFGGYVQGQNSVLRPLGQSSSTPQRPAAPQQTRTAGISPNIFINTGGR